VHGSHGESAQLRARRLAEQLEAHGVRVVALLTQDPAASGRLVLMHMPPGPRSTVWPAIGEPERRWSVQSISILARGERR
jgi:hypothetical protein